MKREPYVYTLPEMFLKDESVPARWRIWAVINGFFINSQKCWASNEWLGEKIGAHKDTVSKAVKELEDSKLIFCSRTRRNRVITPNLSSEIGVGAYQEPGSTPISDRHQRLSISDSNSVQKKRTISEKSLSSSRNSERSNTTGVSYTALDEFGLPIEQKAKKPGPAPRNAVVFRLLTNFVSKAQEATGTKPLPGTTGAAKISYALNTGGLTESQINDLFEEWFDRGMADEKAISITACLSSRNIEKFKVENQLV